MSWNKNNSVDKLKKLNDGYFYERLSALTDWTFNHSAHVTLWVITDIFGGMLPWVKRKIIFESNKRKRKKSNETTLVISPWVTTLLGNSISSQRLLLLVFCCLPVFMMNMFNHIRRAYST